MKFLTLSADPAANTVAWNSYREYLRSVRDRLPAAVAKFAGADWWYNPNDHRSLHDAWVESIRLDETALAASRVRPINIDVTLLGPYHDRRTTLSYRDVSQYALRLDQSSLDGAGGHGDWLIDEIRLSPAGGVIHEVEFSSGATWLIECATIQYATTDVTVAPYRS